MSQRVWVGPAADEFEREVRIYAAVVSGYVLRVRAIASALEAEAHILWNSAARLRSEAAGLEAAGLAVV